MSQWNASTPTFFDISSLNQWTHITANQRQVNKSCDNSDWHAERLQRRPVVSFCPLPCSTIGKIQLEWSNWCLDASQPCLQALSASCRSSLLLILGCSKKRDTGDEVVWYWHHQLFYEVKSLELKWQTTSPFLKEESNVKRSWVLDLALKGSCPLP